MDGCWDWVGVSEGRSDSFCGNLGHFLGFDGLKGSHMMAVFWPLLSICWTKSQVFGYRECIFCISWIQRYVLWPNGQFSGRILPVLGQDVSLFFDLTVQQFDVFWLLFAT